MAPASVVPEEEARTLVTGVVVDERGRPVARAEVRGPEGMRHSAYHSWRFVVHTDQDGRFEASFAARPTPERDRLISHVTARGFLDGWLEGRPEHWRAVDDGVRIDDLVVVLRRALRLEGRVLDARGVPARWASVEHEDRLEGRWHQLLATDREGRFRIEGLDPTKVLRLRASNWGATSSVVEAGPWRPGEVAEPVLLRLPPEPADGGACDGYWEIHGTVVDLAGRPVAGAEVSGPCFGRAPGEGHAAVADEAGHFAGVLRAFGPEHEPGREITARRAGLAFLQHLLREEDISRLVRERAMHDLVLSMRPGAAVRGRVVTPDGEPVAGAEIRVTERADGGRSPPWVTRTTADGDGSFEILDLDPAASWYLLADEGDRVSRYVPLSGRLRVGEVAWIDLPLPSSRAVDLEVEIQGYSPGMSLTVDCLGSVLLGPAWRGRVPAGPHTFTLYDRDSLPVGSGATEIPSDASSWRVVLVATPRPAAARSSLPEGGS